MDDDRIEYFRDHLQQVQNAILNDGCNVKAYTGNNIIYRNMSYDFLANLFYSQLGH